MTTTWRRAMALLVAGACLAVCLADQAGAQKKKKSGGATAEEARATMVDELITAHRLADFGRKHKAPEALIAAGDLLRSMADIKLGAAKEEDGKDVQVTVEDEGGAKKEETGSSEGQKAPSFAQEASDLFDEASAMAGELKLDLNKQIKLARERKYKKDENERAVVGGPRCVHRQINSHQTQVMNFHFYCAQPAAIGFQASIPMRVQAVRDDIGQIWMDGVTMHHVMHGVPGGNPKQKCKVTVRVHNLANVKGQFQLFVN